MQAKKTLRAHQLSLDYSTDNKYLQSVTIDNSVFAFAHRTESIQFVRQLMINCIETKGN